MLLLDWSRRIKSSTVVIKIWLTVTEYPYIKWELTFDFLLRFCLSSITDKTFTGLYYICNTPGVLKQARTSYHPVHRTSPPVFWLLIFLVFCVVLCFFYFVCLRPVSCVPNVTLPVYLYYPLFIARCQCICIIHYLLPVASVSVVSIIYCPLLVYLYYPLCIARCHCICIIHYLLPVLVFLMFIVIHI